MENEIKIGHEPKQNWFLKRAKKYQVITFTVGFLFFNRLITIVLKAYSADKDLFVEIFHLNIWLVIGMILIFYFLQWLSVVLVASKFTKETLKQKFLRHPIATIILFISYVIDLPYRLYYGGLPIFETIVRYAFVYFLWWLLVCWISSKIFKKQRFEWSWYKKIIETIFVLMPKAYKIILGLIVALELLLILFFLIIVIFKYSGKDLEVLFS